MQQNKYEEYKLDDITHQRFLEKIAAHNFTNSKSNLNPISKIIGGQPGAGKGRIIQMAAKNFDNATIINGDEYRKYHPQSQIIFEQHGIDFAKYTDPDVREWTRKILEEAIEKKYNIVFEGTMRTNQILHTMNSMIAKGYTIEVYGLAVNEFLSRLAIFNRFFEELNKNKIARFSPRYSHDAAYQEMPNVIDEIELNVNFRILRIYLRGGIKIYENNNFGISGAKKAVLEGREKVWSKEEKVKWLKRIDELIEFIKISGDKYKILEELLNLRDDFLLRINSLS